MAKVEDENLNLDHPTSLDEVSTPVEPAETTPADEAKLVEDRADEQEKPNKKNKRPSEDEEEKKESDQLAFYAIVGIAIGLPVIFLGLAQFQIVFFSTAFYLIGLGYIPLGLWLGRKTTTIFTVFLACVLAALLTAVYFLSIEFFRRYGGDVKANEAKQRIGMTPPVGRDVVKARLHA